jgi:hypothetical protein
MTASSDVMKTIRFDEPTASTSATAAVETMTAIVHDARQPPASSTAAHSRRDGRMSRRDNAPGRLWLATTTLRPLSRHIIDTGVIAVPNPIGASSLRHPVPTPLDDGAPL